ncbi:aspartate aminotransferase family protein [Haematobacter massiliensis]|uniref:4-aminobutyrate aminotransferase n=1 Tax=Haematobacter massiliensis TaxID=195105 RepID=A0A086Y4R1_9RHOB|nr:aspartate aminotransferase family protein [Haematobacter massiliensis]KFI29261.1 4-aminobutyrate aminotransferase [Haematobacter massiliensis]OWJ71974.1 aspartate aminotransferase family protein [Haematobacter massiliensis]OWJ82160.1 aspartate aminotransferase family protein [Haematobacter massiliensis]QBJ25873.1 aspartate aminotransferase family protein [Haematobacter massiliensis]
MSDETLIARREKVLGPAYRLFYDRPLYLVRGQGARVWDAEGRAYLDAYNNVPSVGHCHPNVVAALAEQAAALNTHTRYLHDNVVDYAERLVATFPAPLSQVMFTCTGSEANDLALRVARSVTGAQGIIVTANAYHGVTAALAEISPSLGPANPLGAHVRVVPAPDSYRLGAEGAERALTQGVKDAVRSLQAAGHGVAAFLCDTVFASDGVFTDPVGLPAGAVAAVRAAGGLFIADEVQSGLARPGGSMWAFERHGLIPDLVTLGKPLGDGHPIAALVAQPQYLEEFGRKTRYFNTFGGNPVSAAVGRAVLDVIAEEGLQENARRVGAALRAALQGLAARHEVVGDVRGAGLYAAVELVSDRAAKTPDGARALRMVGALREAGVLVGSCGAAANCLKIRPPLCFSEADVEELVAALDRCMTQIAAPA